MIRSKLSFYVQIFLSFCLELAMVIFFDQSVIYPVRVCYFTWVLSRNIALPMHGFAIIFVAMSSMVHGYSLNLDLFAILSIVLVSIFSKRLFYFGAISTTLVVSVLFFLTAFLNLGFALTISDILFTIFLVPIFVELSGRGTKGNYVNFLNS